MPRFLVQFGAQAAQVLGGGGGGVGGAGEAFAGALFVVESGGWEERLDVGEVEMEGEVAKWRGRSLDGGDGNSRMYVPFAILLLPALDISVVGQWCALRRGVREGRAYSFWGWHGQSIVSPNHPRDRPTILRDSPRASIIFSRDDSAS